MKSIFLFSFFLLLFAAPALACDCNLSCSGIDDGGACQSNCMANCDDDDPQEAPRIGYGAIAVSEDTMNYGYAHSFDTQEEANATAVKSCGARDCEIQVTFYNSCGALATEDNGWFKKGKHWGTAWARTKPEAEKKAMNYCLQKDVKSCSVQVSVCSE